MHGIKYTISDIAKITGVSKTTISRYLNGKFEYMSDVTKKKIEHAISETGYRPNRIAGSLKTARSDLVGLVLIGGFTMRTPLLLGSVCDYCTKHGRKVIVVISNGKEKDERERIYELIDMQVDGLIVATGINQELYEQLDSTRFPIVMMDRVPSNTKLDWVTSNQYDSVSEVAEFAIKKGFRRIVFFVRSSLGDIDILKHREQGILDVIHQYGDTIVFEKAIIDDMLVNDQSVQNKNILAHIKCIHENCASLPTLIFVADGMLMEKVIFGCYRLGIPLKKNLLVAGYNQVNFGGIQIEGVITIQQPIADIGTLAAKVVINRIDSQEQSLEQSRIQLDCNVDYTSCGL